MGIFDRLFGTSTPSLPWLNPPQPQRPVRLNDMSSIVFKKGQSKAFDKMMKDIEPMDITVVVDPVMLKNLDQAGHYDPYSNTIVLSELPNPAKPAQFYEIMHVLGHEAFHASMHKPLILNRATAAARRQTLDAISLNKGRKAYVDAELDREFNAEEFGLKVTKEAAGKDANAPLDVKNLDVQKELADYQSKFTPFYRSRFELHFTDLEHPLGSIPFRMKSPVASISTPSAPIHINQRPRSSLFQQGQAALTLAQRTYSESRHRQAQRDRSLAESLRLIREASERNQKATLDRLRKSSQDMNRHRTIPTSHAGMGSPAARYGGHPTGSAASWHRERYHASPTQHRNIAHERSRYTIIDFDRLRGNMPPGTPATNFLGTGIFRNRY
nr:hypothetical protein [uncultured bacterium]